MVERKINKSPRNDDYFCSRTEPGSDGFTDYKALPAERTQDASAGTRITGPWSYQTVISAATL